MPATSLLALLDDISSILDDVATLTKVATKKTAGVLGDDLALNAEQVAGMQSERELPVVWAVAKGSVVNKAILVPTALLLSQFAPWSITPLLMFGGLFLCFEGFEKIAHKLLHADHEEAQATVRPSDPRVDLLALEKEKIKGAIRTDFVLSAEIVTIALGTVAEQPLGTRAAVLVSIAAVMTIGVYGLVAGIVKLDDLGLYLTTRNRPEATGGSSFLAAVGRGILRGAPWLMRGLTLAGTVAMFLVGGGILVHGIAWLRHLEEGAAHAVSNIPHVGTFLHGLLPMLISGGAGLVAGGLSVALISLLKKLRGKR